MLVCVCTFFTVIVLRSIQQLIQRVAGETKHCANTSERVNHQMLKLAIICMLKMAFHYICSHVSCSSLCVAQLTSAKYDDPTTSISFRFTPHHAQDWRSCETAPASSSGGLRPRSLYLPKRARPNYMHALNANGI